MKVNNILKILSNGVMAQPTTVSIKKKHVCICVIFKKKNNEKFNKRDAGYQLIDYIKIPKKKQPW